MKKSNKKHTIEFSEEEVKEKIKDFADNPIGEKTLKELLGISSIKGLKIKLYKQNNLYEQKTIPKRNGENRILHIPNPYLKKIQRNLNYLIHCLYGGKFTSHAFEKGKSIITNAELHANKKHILKIDLKDFFGSITFPRVYGIFQKTPFGFDPTTARLLAHICIYQENLSRANLGILPQGAPTSPILANLACRNLDNKLFELCKKLKCTYSRYADDITISTNLNEFPTQLFKENILSAKLEKIINGNGFEVNFGKVKLISSKRRQMVTGLIVNKKVNVKRSYIKGIRAMLHQWQKLKEDYYNVLKKEKEKITIKKIRIIKKANFNKINEKNKEQRKKIINNLINDEKYYSSIHYISQRASLIEAEARMHKKYYEHTSQKPKFKRVLTGRIGFIKRVRGAKDNLYIKLWNKYCLLNNKKRNLKKLTINNPNNHPLWEIINKGESLELEFKQNYSEQHLLETVNAFLNSDRGGLLIFGIEDVTHLVTGIGDKIRGGQDSFRINIISKIFQKFKPTQQLPVMCKFDELHNKTICCVEVQPYGKKIYFDEQNKEYFMRMDGFSQKMQDDLVMST